MRQNRFVSEKRKSRGVVAVVVIAFFLLIYSLPAYYEPQTMAKRGWCITCHMPKEQPVIKGLAQYKRIHQRPTAADSKLMAELIRCPKALP